MFRRILVPVDGSTFAELALAYAVRTARTFGARLELALVHVRYEPATADLGLREAIHEWERDHRHREADYLHQLAERVSAELGQPAEPVMLSGDVVPALAHEMKQRGTDLVIMTTHGRSGFERAWLGSVADSLVRHVDTPVLLIRPSDRESAHSADEPGFTHVLVALDGSERAHNALRPAIALARAHDAKITLLRAVAPPAAVMSPYIPHAAVMTRTEVLTREHVAQEYIQQEVSLLRLRGIDAEGDVVVDQHAAHALLAFAEARDVDLIVLGSHGRGPIRRFVLGSVTDKVVRGARVPVLVC